ncbi:hypothetical protein [Parasphingorhabdus flavimaris]
MAKIGGFCGVVLNRIIAADYHKQRDVEQGILFSPSFEEEELESRSQ